MSYIMNLRKLIGTQPIHTAFSGVIVHVKDKILLQRRRDFNLWAIHGGALDLAESLEACAERELFEETHLKPNNLIFLKCYAGKDFYIKYPDGNEVYSVNHVFVTTEVSGTMKPQVEEVTELKWFSIEELPWDAMMPENKIFLKDYLKTLARGV